MPKSLLKKWVFCGDTRLEEDALQFTDHAHGFDALQCGIGGLG